MAWELDQCLIKVDPQPSLDRRVGARRAGQRFSGAGLRAALLGFPRPSACCPNQARLHTQCSLPFTSRRWNALLRSDLWDSSCQEFGSIWGCLPGAKHGLLHQHHTALPSCPHLGRAKQRFAEETEGDLPRVTPHCPWLLISPQHWVDLSLENSKAGVE